MKSIAQPLRSLFLAAAMMHEGYHAFTMVNKSPAMLRSCRSPRRSVYHVLPFVHNSGDSSRLRMQDGEEESDIEEPLAQGTESISWLPSVDEEQSKEEHEVRFCTILLSRAFIVCHFEIILRLTTPARSSHRRPLNTNPAPG
jgi:hypothetical protein